jgi:putative intracellular protease/amidase
MNQPRPTVLIVLTNNNKLYDRKAQTMRQTGTYFTELWDFYKEAWFAGARIMVATPEGGVAPLDPSEGSMNIGDDAHDSQLVSIKNNLTGDLLFKTSPLNRLSPRQFDMVMIPGGHGLLADLPGNGDLAYMLRGVIQPCIVNGEVMQPPGVIAAVCHGPAAFLGVSATNTGGSPLIENVTLTSFSKKEEIQIGLDEMVADAIGMQLEDRLRSLGSDYRSNDENFAEFVTESTAKFVLDTKDGPTNFAGQIITGQNPNSARETAKRAFQALSRR